MKISWKPRRVYSINSPRNLELVM